MNITDFIVRKSMFLSPPSPCSDIVTSPSYCYPRNGKIMDHEHRAITRTILGHMFLHSGTAGVMEEINLSGLSLT